MWKRSFVIGLVILVYMGLSASVRAQSVVKQTWTQREVLRNGDLRLGQLYWGWQNAIPSPEAGTQVQQDSGVAMQVNQQSPQAMVFQQLYLPSQVSAASFSMNYRLGAMAQQFALQDFSASLVVVKGNQQQLLVKLLEVKAEAAREGWQSATYMMTAQDLQAVNAARAQASFIYLRVQLAGQNIAAHVDNLSLKVDGTLVTPVFKTGLAVVKQYSKGGFKIQFVNPANGETSSMYKTPRPIGTCYGLTWRPDGQGLCFSSSHEAPFSRFTADIFELDRTGMRRVTNGPSVARLKAMKDAPTGEVEITLENFSAQQQGVLQVYVQGARDVASVTLGPRGQYGAKQKVVLRDVVDFGPGVPQYVVAHIGGRIFNGTFVDVQAGKRVEHKGTVMVDQRGLRSTASNPSYTADGKQIIFTAGGLLLNVSREGGPGGQKLYGNLSVLNPVASPVGDSVLYRSVMGDDIYLVKAGQNAVKVVGANTQANPGQVSTMGPLAWLPDGSGFLYTVSNQMGGNDIYLFGLERKEVIPLVHLGNEQVQQMVVSPDGSHLAIVRNAVAPGMNANVIRSLWVVPMMKPANMWELPMKHVPGLIAWQPKSGG